MTTDVVSPGAEKREGLRLDALLGLKGFDHACWQSTMHFGMAMASASNMVSGTHLNMYPR